MKTTFHSLGISFDVTCIKDVADKLNEMSDGCQDDISENDVIVKYIGNQDKYVYYIPTSETNRGGLLGVTNKLIPYSTTPRYKL